MGIDLVRTLIPIYLVCTIQNLVQRAFDWVEPIGITIVSIILFMVFVAPHAPRKENKK